MNEQDSAHGRNHCAAYYLEKEAERAKSDRDMDKDKDIKRRIREDSVPSFKVGDRFRR